MHGAHLPSCCWNGSCRLCCLMCEVPKVGFQRHQGCGPGGEEGSEDEDEGRRRERRRGYERASVSDEDDDRRSPDVGA